MKKSAKVILSIYSSLLIISCLGIAGYSYYAVKDLSEPEIKQVLQKNYSTIYDHSGRLIETMGSNKYSRVRYDELPQILIDALISIEDQEFFYHEGMNFKRIFSSIFHNVFSSSTQGGSTLTQQLVKNLLLSNEKSLKRKIQEGYLASLLESKMTKEEILELYFNEVYFDGSIPGISYAAKKYFNKSVSHLNLVECASLVGLVKSPTAYSPILHIEKNEQRKNVVIQAMLENHKITSTQAVMAKNKKVQDLLNIHYESEETFVNQAYLDLVYSEVQELTGYNPFSVAMEIHTYLDTSLQNYFDQVQEGKAYEFEDDLQQVGGAVIQNEDASIIGILGGRNYSGMLLFNHAYDLKRQPASTMKPIFTYALAMEHLNKHEYSIVEDIPYTYPGTSIEVQNSDKKFLGEIPIVDAIGYSRNTATLYLLEELIHKVGQEELTNYLKNIGMMDEGTFTRSYALGGMKYGINPINLAGAYAMLARNGNFLKPSTISEIRLIDTGEVIYSRTLEGKQVLQEESAYKVTSTLEKVMDGNYYNISYAKPQGINICAKTGTNAYDANTIRNNKFPSYADKDIWFAGYSKNYSLAFWSGFDKIIKNQKCYFGHNDSRRLVCKDLFRNTLQRVELKNQRRDMPSTLKKVGIVKGLKKDYLPNELIPDAFIVYPSFRANEVPSAILPYPVLEKIESFDVVCFEDEIQVQIQHLLQDDELYTPIFGKKQYLCTYMDEESSIVEVTTSNTISFPNKEKDFTISICETFENNISLCGEITLFEYRKSPSIWPF